MSTILKSGIILGILCALWTLVMGYTGWYKHPVMLNLFWVVILIEIVVLFRGLQLTAAKGWNYGKQLGAGTLMSVIGGLVIAANSIAFTTVLFPSYFQDVRALQEQMLLQQGMNAADIQITLDAAAVSATPAANAITGFIGTVVTGIIISAVVAIWVRGKRAEV